MAAERNRVPNMIDTFMYPNKPTDIHPGFGAPPTYRPLQNVQPYDAQVGLDPFPPNVPQTRQLYENHIPLGTQFWGVADSEWNLKESRVRVGSASGQRRNPITDHVENRTGFLHTGLVGSEYRTPPVDPRYKNAVYGNQKSTTLDFKTKNSNLLFN